MTLTDDTPYVTPFLPSFSSDVFIPLFHTRVYLYPFPSSLSLTLFFTLTFLPASSRFYLSFFHTFAFFHLFLLIRAPRWLPTAEFDAVAELRVSFDLRPTRWGGVYSVHIFLGTRRIQRPAPRPWFSIQGLAIAESTVALNFTMGFYNEFNTIMHSCYFYRRFITVCSFDT